MTEHEAAKVDRVETVRVLRRVDELEHREWIQPGRQRQLDDETGACRVVVELAHDILELLLRRGGRQLALDAGDPDLRAVAVLSGDIRMAARIVADEHRAESGVNPESARAATRTLRVGLDGRAAAAPVEDPRRHAAQFPARTGGVDQWEKCRVPVRVHRHAGCLGRGDHLRVRTEPPGCTTARTPASVSTSSPSGNGKNASEAATEPRARSSPPATPRAGRHPPDSPGPCRRRRWSTPASRMAFDRAARHARQAKTRSRSVMSSAGSPAASCQAEGSSPGASSASAICMSMPPLIRRHSAPPRARGAGQRSRRRSLRVVDLQREVFELGCHDDLGEDVGYLRGHLRRQRGVDGDDTAVRRDRIGVVGLPADAPASSPTAMPQGLACLTIATHGSAKS